jgi:glycosyltransferase involved in cell wall biosynthesis
MVMDGLLTPGADFVYSGGDRYTRDLAFLLRDMGVETVIFQRAEKAFSETWEGVKVFGLPSGKKAGQLNVNVMTNTQDYHAHIYFHMLLAYPSAARRSVSISHGIWFDHIQNPPCSDDTWREWRMNLESAISGVNKIVSVDTNTINFFGALFAGRFHQKFTHIPNAVDVDIYTPRTTKRKGNYRVLYPRRFDGLRGSKEMTCIADALHDTHKDWEWHLCGATHSDGVKEAVEKWASRSERYSYYRKSFDEMPQVYRDADIAVIPTMGAEGTSYSAIEALATGLPVVTTYVGGLSELVIDGHNGIKVAPFYDDLRDAVDYLIRNPRERERLGRNARSTAMQFSLNRWKASWAKVIEDLLR